KARAAGISPEAATQVGVTAAQLSQFDVGKEGERGDLAAKLNQYLPGGPSERQLEVLAKSKNREETLNLIAASAQSGIRTRTWASIQDEAYTPDDPGKLAQLKREKKMHHKLFAPGSEKQRELNLAQIPAGDERFEAMVHDPSLVKAEQREAFTELLAGAEKIKTQKRKTINQQIAEREASTDSATQSQLREERTATYQSHTDEIGAAEERDKATREKKIEADLERKHPIFSLIPGFKRAESFFQVRLKADPTYDDVRDEGGDAEDKLTESDESKARRGLGPAPKVETPGPQSRAGDQHLELLGDIRSLLVRQNSLMRTRRDTTLSNDRVEQA